MGTGINLGNTLDAPTEGAWTNGKKAQEAYFESYKKMGFTTVRVPVTWDKHTGTSSPFTIDRSWLARVGQVLNWGLSRGMVMVVNVHHDDWIDNEGNFSWQLPRLLAIWTQISEYFKDFPENLLFEIYNEPHVMNSDQLNTMNKNVHSIIRKTNPDRIIILGGLQWNSPYWLISNPNTLWLPNDKQIMIEVHNYDPYPYCRIGPTQHYWGSDSDKAQVKSWMDSLKAWANSKGGLAIYYGELGVTTSQKAGNGRYTWWNSHASEWQAHGFAGSAWDDGGSYEVFHRSSSTWDWDFLHAIGCLNGSCGNAQRVEEISAPLPTNVE